MKKIIIFSVFVFISFFYYSKSYSMNNDTLVLNNIDYLAKYAVTDEQKYYFNLLNSYIKNPESLMGEKMNPAIDEEAKKIANLIYEVEKKYILALYRLLDKPRTESMKIIKVLKKEKNNQFYKLNKEPDNSLYAVILLSLGLSSQTFKDYPMISIYYKSETVNDAEKLMKQLEYAFSFLDNDSSWIKSKSPLLKLYKTLLKRDKLLLKQYKQAYDKASFENLKFSAEKNIKKAENSIKSNQKVIKNLKSGKIKELVYSYIWQGAGIGKANRINIDIRKFDNNIILNISKMIWR